MFANEKQSSYPEITAVELAVEVTMIKLQLLILPFISGRIHVQVSPRHAFSTSATVTAARRIISLASALSSSATKDRICIKIPSTWEGLHACKILESEHSIATLATTLFTLSQAIAAGEAGCTYIAPYVNDLRVHFEPGFVDPNVRAASKLCADAQKMFKSRGFGTKILPASLTSTDEIMALRGSDHITISPPLLEALKATTGGSTMASVLDVMDPDSEAQTNGVARGEVQKVLDDEGRFRMEGYLSNRGADEVKLVHAINIFFGCQEKLEALTRVCMNKMDMPSR